MTENVSKNNRLVSARIYSVEESEDPLAAPRGVWNACLFSIPIWLGIFSIVVVIWTFVHIIFH